MGACLEIAYSQANQSHWERFNNVTGDEEGKSLLPSINYSCLFIDHKDSVIMKSGMAHISKHDSLKLGMEIDCDLSKRNGENRSCMYLAIENGCLPLVNT